MGSRKIVGHLSHTRGHYPRLRINSAPRSRVARAVGAAIVQIDHLHLCLFVDDHLHAGYSNPDQAADFSVDMNNRLIDGIAGVTMAVHLCRRTGAPAWGEADHTGGFDKIMPQLGRLSRAISPWSSRRRVPVTIPFSVGYRRRSKWAWGVSVASPVRLIRLTRSWDGLKRHYGISIRRGSCSIRTVDHALGSAADVSIDEVHRKLKNEAAARILRDKYTWYSAVHDQYPFP